MNEGLLKKILIVDDEAVIRELLGEIMETLGYSVVLCATPSEAIQVFKAMHQEIDLIFMDMIMPEISGRQLYHEFIKIDASKKVIVLSGYAIGNEVQSLIQDGIYGFVQKPISVKELSKIIKEAIG